MKNTKTAGIHHKDKKYVYEKLNTGRFEIKVKEGMTSALNVHAMKREM
jgi:hypothetical protein